MRKSGRVPGFGKVNAAPSRPIRTRIRIDIPDADGLDKPRIVGDVDPDDKHGRLYPPVTYIQSTLSCGEQRDQELSVAPADLTIHLHYRCSSSDQYRKATSPSQSSPSFLSVCFLLPIPLSTMATTIESASVAPTVASCHPLQLLNDKEIRTASSILRKHVQKSHGEHTKVHFKNVSLHDPPKALLLPYLDAEAAGVSHAKRGYVPRCVDIVWSIENGRKVAESVISLDAQTVIAEEHMARGQHGHNDKFVVLPADGVWEPH